MSTEVLVAKLPTCIFCKARGRKIDAEYDAVTNEGAWAFMCQRHFDQHGQGLGEALGQKLVLVKNGVRRIISGNT